MEGIESQKDKKGKKMGLLGSLDVMMNAYGTGVAEKIREKKMVDFLFPGGHEFDLVESRYVQTVVLGDAIPIPMWMNELPIDYSAIESTFSKDGAHSYVRSVVKQLGLPEAAIGVDEKTPLPTRFSFMIVFLLKAIYPKIKITPIFELLKRFRKVSVD